MKEEWLFPGAMVPVDMETTTALVVEIKRLINVVGGMVLKQGPDYERGFIDGMSKQAQSSVDKAVNAMTQPSNFCPRCGKRRGGDVNYIHTCTPPHQLGYPDTLDVMSTLRPRTFDDYGNKLPPTTTERIITDSNGRKHITTELKLPSCPPCNNHCDQGRNCSARNATT